MMSRLEQLLEEINHRKTSHMEWYDESFGDNSERRLIKIKIEELEDIRNIIINYYHKENVKK